MDDIARARTGLGDLPARLRERECAVAYFGASVLAQRDGYRSRLHAWLRRHTGRAHREINAGLGAVGSVSAVFLLDELVLRHCPDLCILDYSSGDIASQSPPEQLASAVEGIVRKLHGAGCRSAIIHSYRCDRRHDPLDFVIETWERLADHYGIPSINVGLWAERAITAGSLRSEDLFRDGIHTTAQGAEAIADLLGAALAPLLAQNTTKKVDLPPLTARPYLATTVVAATPAMTREPGRCIEGRFRLVAPYIEIGADNAFEVRFDGDLVGLVLIGGGEEREIHVRTPAASFALSVFDASAPVERYATAVLPAPIARGVPVIVEGPIKLVAFLVLG